MRGHKWLLKQPRGPLAARVWFLEIAFVGEIGMCVYVHVCVCVCPRP